MDASLNQLKGVGPRRIEQLSRLSIYNLDDLINFYPRAYEDWSKIVGIDDAPYGEPCCIKATALEKPREHFIRKGMSLYKFRVFDGLSYMNITIFNNKYAAAKIIPQSEYLFFGVVSGSITLREMTSPMIESAKGGDKIRPIYPQTEGLSSKNIENFVREALTKQPHLRDHIPVEYINQLGFVTYHEAINSIHFPKNSEALANARKRLVFDELLTMQLGLFKLKNRSKKLSSLNISDDFSADFEKLLPFSLTNAQKRAIRDCTSDMKNSSPMNRLIQGDVGSGKTAVAASVAFTVIKNGYQAALMAPTEILAEQHAKSISSLLQNSGITTALLTGSLTAAKKREIYEQLANGTIDFVIGTHAIISKGVEFKNLALVVTDEQHRFGVNQRAKLLAKGDNPHTLVMSATPIPRTLALMVHGDLDISILDELPPGRTPIETYCVDSGKRTRALKYVKKHIDMGQQAYIVCPLVEDSDGVPNLSSATEYYESLKSGIFRGYNIGLLHGKMKSKDKDEIMSRFSKNEISLLVSTTVIEVGVDVPNATIIVIENAERFGLAQLHQLRGRVGRGTHKSTCILITDAQNDDTAQRMQVIAGTNDGFIIADEDLKLRGPGDFFGNRQHGLPKMKIANLAGGDMPVLREAQKVAGEIIAADPLLEQDEHILLAKRAEALFDQTGEVEFN